MNKFMCLMMLIIGVAILPNSARADVGFHPAIGGLGDNFAEDAGGTPIADGTYALILDIDGNGWNGNSYLTQSLGADNGSSWSWDLNDILLDRGKIEGGIAFPSAVLSGNPATNVPGYDAGVDNYYLLWFDKAFDLAATGPGGNVNYGAELLGKVGADGNDLTADAIGGKATLHTLGATNVPEPVSSVLALLGGGAMALRRRFNRVKMA